MFCKIELSILMRFIVYLLCHNSKYLSFVGHVIQLVIELFIDV